MIIVIVAIINYIFFAWLIYRYDLFEREPWYALISCSAICAIFTHGYCWTADYAIDGLMLVGPQRFAVAFVAGVGEELVKLVSVGITLIIFYKHFNDPFDGLIYGAFAGLGFALVETWMYDALEANLSLGVRCVHLFARLLVHALLGSITCAGLGYWRFREKHWKRIFFTLTTSAMALHFAYDYALLGMSSGRPELLPRQQVFLVIVMVCLITLFARTVIVGSNKSSTIHGKKGRSLLKWPFNVFFKTDGEGQGDTEDK